ncbi:MAG: hypothetical protein HEP80_07350 [Dolichospermum sp. UKL201]|nr:MAG: hypothetical protein HEP80_07350 [Dolichospermum sp. UKL201]
MDLSLVFPITNHQSPITNHQSPITNYQSPITNHQLPNLRYNRKSANFMTTFTDRRCFYGAYVL